MTIALRKGNSDVNKNVPVNNYVICFEGFINTDVENISEEKTTNNNGDSNFHLLFVV